MKRYNIYISGGEMIATMVSTSIASACKTFIETLSKPARYKAEDNGYASISYKDNYSICSDFVVIQA